MSQQCAKCNAAISVATGETLLCTSCSFALSESERNTAARAAESIERGSPRAVLIAIVAPLAATFATAWQAVFTATRLSEGAHELLGWVLFILEASALVCGAVAVWKGRGQQRIASGVGIALALLVAFPVLVIFVMSGGHIGD